MKKRPWLAHFLKKVYRLSCQTWMEKNSASRPSMALATPAVNRGKFGSTGLGIWKMVIKPSAFPAATMKSTVSTRDTFVMAVLRSEHHMRPSCPVWRLYLKSKQKFYYWVIYQQQNIYLQCLLYCHGITFKIMKPSQNSCFLHWTENRKYKVGTY